jgi:hypothetical protein
VPELRRGEHLRRLVLGMPGANACDDAEPGLLAARRYVVLLSAAPYHHVEACMNVGDTLHFLNRDWLVLETKDVRFNHVRLLVISIDGIAETKRVRGELTEDGWVLWSDNTPPQKSAS